MKIPHRIKVWEGISPAHNNLHRSRVRLQKVEIIPLITAEISSIEKGASDSLKRREMKDGPRGEKLEDWSNEEKGAEKINGMAR